MRIISQETEDLGLEIIKIVTKEYKGNINELVAMFMNLVCSFTYVQLDKEKAMCLLHDYFLLAMNNCHKRKERMDEDDKI